MVEDGLEVLGDFGWGVLEGLLQGGWDLCEFLFDLGSYVKTPLLFWLLFSLAPIELQYLLFGLSRFNTFNNLRHNLENTPKILKPIICIPKLLQHSHTNSMSFIKILLYNTALYHSDTLLDFQKPIKHTRGLIMDETNDPAFLE